MIVTIANQTKNYNDNIRRARIVTNKYFQLMILPTERCNLRCTYCYEDFLAGRMNKETIIGIKALLDKRSPSLDVLQISWFGGEPLTAKDIVLEISEYASTLVSKYPKLHYKGDITTNGYLLDYNVAADLADVGVKHYQISLDGPRDVHNKSRIRANGSDTYDRIWNNLLAIRDSSLPVSVMLRIHFTADTLKLIDPLLEDIKKEFIHDSRFSVLFKAIERLGGLNDESIKILSDIEKIEAIKLLKIKLCGESIESSSSLSQVDDVCYASKPNSLVIRSNGDVAKCTVALNDERNKIATLHSDGTLKLIPGRLAPWVRGIETLDPAALACPLVGLPPIKEATSKTQEIAL
ncbi:radical SAM protein [aff. Roholtiella sp. LEGE 12411]|uniref:radical SAM protein n=1 Tax=aff. Roholtiella sp. LEGE 12411 TaxID=1828822 RepID=UPI0018820C9D|nr:radical SAM protein [aff. Roholtiella sp. LEGE 12411]MBE9035712.1 radical SAM protein [aff. Roholtiella sp. LEGE 12411]